MNELMLIIKVFAIATLMLIFVGILVPFYARYCPWNNPKKWFKTKSVDYLNWEITIAKRTILELETIQSDNSVIPKGFCDLRCSMEGLRKYYRYRYWDFPPTNIYWWYGDKRYLMSPSLWYGIRISFCKDYIKFLENLINNKKK